MTSDSSCIIEITVFVSYIKFQWDFSRMWNIIKPIHLSQLNWDFWKKEVIKLINQSAQFFLWFGPCPSPRCEMFTVVKIKRQRSFSTIWSCDVGPKDIKGKHDFFHYIKIEHLWQQDSRTLIRLSPLMGWFRNGKSKLATSFTKILSFS